jgi:hypothetical protein
VKSLECIRLAEGRFQLQKPVDVVLSLRVLSEEEFINCKNYSWLVKKALMYWSWLIHLRFLIREEFAKVECYVRYFRPCAHMEQSDCHCKDIL